MLFRSAYHLIAEQDAGYGAVAFDEGHYLQIEVVGKIAGTDQSELAEQFMAFVVSDAFQSIIPTTNWMYPAKLPASGLPEGFETLITPLKSLSFDEGQVVDARSKALEEWLSALSK